MSFRAIVELTDTSANLLYIQHNTSGRAEFGQFWDVGNTWQAALSSCTGIALSSNAGHSGAYYADVNMAAVSAISAYAYTQVRLVYTTSAEAQLTSEDILLDAFGNQILHELASKNFYDFSDELSRRLLAATYSLPFMPHYVYWIDPNIGNDVYGTGSQNMPFKSISAGLSALSSNAQEGRNTGALLINGARWSAAEENHISDINVEIPTYSKVAIIGDYAPDKEDDGGWTNTMWYTDTTATHLISLNQPYGELVLHGIQFVDYNNPITGGSLIKCNTSQSVLTVQHCVFKDVGADTWCIDGEAYRLLHIENNKILNCNGVLKCAGNVYYGSVISGNRIYEISDGYQGSDGSPTGIVISINGDYESIVRYNTFGYVNSGPVTAFYINGGGNHVFGPNPVQHASQTVLYAEAGGTSENVFIYEVTGSEAYYLSAASATTLSALSAYDIVGVASKTDVQSIAITGLSGEILSALSAYGSSGVAEQATVLTIAITGLSGEILSALSAYGSSGVAEQATVLTIAITGSSSAQIVDAITGHGNIYWTKIVGIPLEQFKILVE